MIGAARLDVPSPLHDGPRFRLRAGSIAVVGASRRAGTVGWRIREGACRGEAPVDRDMLVEVIRRVSQVVGDHEDILELDINPFLALAEGGAAVDARVRIGPAPRRTGAEV